MRDPDVRVGALPVCARVVAVCAHPDDESFGLGAIIAAFVDQGTTIDLICLTRGEASTLGVGAGPLAALRRAELVAATDELGIDRVEVAEFADGALAAVAPETLHELIRPVVLGADALLVFDDSGVTGHADHRAATRAALGVADDLDLVVLGWTLPAGVARLLNAALTDNGLLAALALTVSGPFSMRQRIRR
jgi:LmbE family N-acetylglucosaminyl deacetylase